mmetsp:Transcript_5396/g.15081  ORF Transcript_5396/g.15081 Transcript_5396/m.15081 type:complete len:1291 (+) Transcript_5396:160-4032(+)
MEVCVANVDNVPEGCMLALTAGHSRRLAPLAAKQKFAFALPAVNSAACAGGSGMKIEVLTIQGGARLEASNLMTAVSDKGVGGIPKSHRFEVPLELATGIMKVGLQIRPAPAEHKGRGAREAQRLARMASPDSGREDRVKKQRLVPVDELASSADEAVGGGGAGVGAGAGADRKGGKHRHNVALEARTYLEEHRILPFVEEMMRVLVKDRPENPWSAIAGLFPKAEAAKIPAVQLDLAPATAPAEKKSNVRDLVSGRHDRSRSPTRSLSPTRAVMATTPSGFAKTKATMAAFTHFELCLENVEYARMARHGHLMQGVVLKVHDIISARVKPATVSSLEVESGRGSVVLSAKIRSSTEAAAQEVKASIDDDSKAFLHQVDAAIRSLPGIAEVLRPEAKASSEVGARGLSTFVRSRLLSAEDEEALEWQRRSFKTMSTMAPSGSAYATQESWFSGAGDQEATMLSPGRMSPFATREIQVPEAVCTSGAQVLRMVLKEQLLNNIHNGGLHNAIAVERTESGRKTRNATKATILAALRSGDLAGHLQRAAHYRASVVEQTRQTAKFRILNGLDDGTLEAALATALGPVSEVSAAAVEVRAHGQEMTKDEVRAEVKRLLVQSAHDKQLAPALSAWTIEKYHLMYDPRPISLEPFKEYFAENFKWVDMIDLRSMYEPFPRADKRPSEDGPPPLPGARGFAEEEGAAKSVAPARDYYRYAAAHFARLSKVLPPTPPGVSPRTVAHVAETADEAKIMPPLVEEEEEDSDDDEPTPELDDDGVAVNLRLQNIEYSDLREDPELLAAFEWETRCAIAAQAGVPPEYVVLHLSQGSVIVEATIVRPTTSVHKVQDIESSLTSAGPQLSASIITGITKLKGLAAVAKGEIVASEYSVKPIKTTVAKEAAKLQAVVAMKKLRKLKKAQAAANKTTVEVEPIPVAVLVGDVELDGETGTVYSEQTLPIASPVASIKAQPDKQQEADLLVEEELKREQEAAQKEAEERRVRELEDKRLLEEELARREEEEVAKRKQEALRAQAVIDAEMRRLQEEAQRRAAAEEAQRKAAKEAARRQAEEEEEAKQRALEEARRQQEELEERIRKMREDEKRQKDAELMEVFNVLASLPACSDSDSAMGMSQRSPGGMNQAMSSKNQFAASSSDLEEIQIGDRVEVINSLYVGQDGMEVLAGWQGVVEEINDGDAVILFFGMDEGRYVLREDYGNLIVIRTDPSVSSSSAEFVANACHEAVNQNEQLRVQNAALRVELDRLLALATPMSTPPLTGVSQTGGRAPSAETPPMPPES